MKLTIEQRLSDSPLVERIYRTYSDEIDTFTSIAANHFEFVVWKYQGKTNISLRGPETKATSSPVPEYAQFFGIIFKLGVYMPHLPVSQLVDSAATMPDTLSHSFITVTSQDGARIAFDKLGSGSAVIIVNGAMSFRATNPTLVQLAELLVQQFTVYNYDRRGRGESSDTRPFDKQREIEDVQALVEDAGGEAKLFGISSGGALALEAAAATPGISKAAVYEVPLIIDDSRQPLPDYAEHTARLAAEGRLDELVEYFIIDVVGVPAEYAAGMKQDQETWAGMLALALTSSCSPRSSPNFFSK